ncbi:hypothetical protein HPB50_003591 [Hyalomma asiaticum]|uniref:Uncharacterized protein n=1 Tax=Hyalomma asiaticum TaxID=266040 RepID=A0ACB7SRX3_HYAAI|nr:hypothetical protein HPB50_003591 [Hyalomma asiaticum]
MTTNKSAEVDVLADRAVVLARGVVQLNDDVDNLRKDLRLGYRLCIQRHERALSGVITSNLTSRMPGLRVLSVIGLEIMLYMPGATAAKARQFARLIRNELRYLGITHVGDPYRTIEDGVMRIWGRIHQPDYTAPSNPDHMREVLRLHLERPESQSFIGSMRRRFVALTVKKLRLLWAHWLPLLCASLASGVLFYVLYESLAGRIPPLGFIRGMVRLEASSVGLKAFVRDWRPSPEFAGVVIRSLLEDGGVHHQVPLDEEPEWYLRSLRAHEWRRHGWGIEIHAGRPGPGGSGHWVTLWWSGERWATSGAALTMLHAAQLANASRVRGARIHAQAGSLPNARWTPSAQEVLEHAFNDVPVVACVLAVSAVIAPMTGLFAAIPRSENRCGLQLLQLMTGLLSFDYWLSHFLWDFVVLYVLGFCVPMTPAFLWFFGDRGVSFSRVVPTLLEIIWDAEGPGAAPMGRKLTLASRAVPSSALSAGLAKLLRLHGIGQLCELPQRQRVTICRDLKPRLMARRTVVEALALCCPETNELDIKEVPSWSDLLARDVSLMYDVAALLVCAIVALLLLSLGDAVLVPLLHRIRYLAWRKAGTSTTRKVTAIEASGLMSPVSPLAFRPPLPSSAPPVRTGSVRFRATTPSSAPSIGSGGARSMTPSSLSSALPPGSSSPSVLSDVSPLSPTREVGEVVLEAVGLERRFGGEYAVRSVSLSVRERECVGLLGQSGAGKSTTLRMLSGELLPTAGASAVYGNDLRSQRVGYVTCVGYQPSIGGYAPELTARQHLELVAVLRLLPSHNVSALVNHLLRFLDLDLEADKKTELYCRSSLRKLGMAMALLGAPRLVLLDAPTSGIDPISARTMWHAVDVFTKANDQALVLASTLIPECLALCSRVLVLSGGECTWSGAVADLRNTFFMGMVITVTLTVEQKDATMVVFLRRVNEIFEGEAHMVSKKKVTAFLLRPPSFRAHFNDAYLPYTCRNGTRTAPKDRRM